uniref:DNA-directed RNA polymerase III subunit RPC9 n=1 Tax=Chenopodium quinoa TaxID=63459 RepID=A0A803MP83_CHEQI
MLGFVLRNLCNAGILTNFEVLDLLHTRGAAKEPTRVMGLLKSCKFKVDTLALFVYDYLVESAACDQTRESINDLIEKFKEYQLPKDELINIINNHPFSAVELAPASTLLMSVCNWVPRNEVYYDRPGTPSTPDDSILDLPPGQHEAESDQDSSQYFSLSSSNSSSDGSKSEQGPSEKPDKGAASPERGQGEASSSLQDDYTPYFSHISLSTQKTMLKGLDEFRDTYVMGAGYEVKEGSVKPPVVPRVNLRPPKRTAEEASPTPAKRSRKTVAHKSSTSDSGSHPSIGGKSPVALSALKEASESKDSPSAREGTLGRRQGKQVQDLVIISDIDKDTSSLRRQVDSLTKKLANQEEQLRSKFEERAEDEKRRLIEKNEADCDRRLGPRACGAGGALGGGGAGGGGSH